MLGWNSERVANQYLTPILPPYNGQNELLVIMMKGFRPAYIPRMERF